MNLMNRRSLVARALEIAPECKTSKLVRSRLKYEGYSANEILQHFTGKSFRNQVKSLLAQPAPNR
jgi:hypothetical protein